MVVMRRVNGPDKITGTSREWIIPGLLSVIRTKGKETFAITSHTTQQEYGRNLRKTMDI